MKSEDLIKIIYKRCGINAPVDGQFISKEHLLLIIAHLEKQNIHIESLKKEVEDARNDRARIQAMKESLEQEMEG